MSARQEGRRRYRIRAWLLALVVTATLPVTLFAGYVAYKLADKEREAMLAQVSQRTEAMASAVDRRLDSSFAALNALAVSDEMARDDFEGLYHQAQRLLAAQSIGTAVVVVGKDGRQIINTRRPFHDQLPNVSAFENIQRVFETESPLVSNLFPGSVGPNIIVSTDLPVRINGKVVYALRMGILPAALNRVLDEQKLPEEWVGLILDRAGNVVAHTQAADSVVGRRLPLADAMTKPAKGVVEGQVEGVDATTIYLRSPSSGWVAAIAIPKSTLSRSLWKLLATVCAGGIVMLMAGVALALAVARRLERQVAWATLSATQLGGGARPSVMPTDILELAELSEAHQAAGELLRRREEEREAQRRAAQDSLERLRFALASAAAGIWEMDLRTGTVLWTEETFRLYGRPPHGAPPSYPEWLDLVHPADRAAAEEALRATIASRRSLFDCQFRVLRGDGAVTWLASYGRVSYGADGGAQWVIGLNIDITKLMAAEQAMREAKQDAERANLAKSKFLAAASHDLRQPFQAMRLFHQVLLQRLRDEGDLKIAARLGEAMAGGEELLNALLDVSTLDAGTVKTNIEPFPADDVLARVFAECEPQAHAKGLRLRYVPSKAVLVSDRVLLARMVRNLVVNAIRYTETGGVLIGCRRWGAAARVEVWDTGIGIPENQHKLVFEDFYQVGNDARERTKGLGLGLSVVARTGRLLGHPIGIQSKEGKGSVFSVTLPTASLIPVAAE